MNDSQHGINAMRRRPFKFPAIYLLLLPPIFLIGCGCCLIGGGNTGRAEDLDYANKTDGFGIGGPGWPLLKRLGARVVEETQPGFATLIRGTQKLQSATFRLENLTEDRRNEIFALYERALNAQKSWVVLTRRRDDTQDARTYAHYDQDSLRGLFVIIIKGEKMTVFQILGEIRPQVFAELNVYLDKYGVRLPVADVVFKDWGPQTPVPR